MPNPGARPMPGIRGRDAGCRMPNAGCRMPDAEKKIVKKRQKAGSRTRVVPKFRPKAGAAALSLECLPQTPHFSIMVLSTVVYKRQGSSLAQTMDSANALRESHDSRPAL